MKSKVLVEKLFQFHLELELYHWQTKNYARHKATDKLKDYYIEFKDLFVESYMGKYGRVGCPNNVRVRSFTDKNVEKNLIKPFIVFLNSFDKEFKNDEDLLNLKDEIVSRLQQTLYLFTLD